MNWKVGLHNIGFAIFQVQVIIAFILPEIVQKPFKILLGVGYFTLFILLLIEKEIKPTRIIPAFLVLLFSVIVIMHGAYQSSLVNAIFSTFGLLIVRKLGFEFTEKKMEFARIVYWVALGSIILQLLFYRYDDGRPKLGYEINLSAAFLFLFFLYSDYLKIRIGKVFIILVSLVVLSRLLILAILLHYLMRFLRTVVKVDFKLNFPLVALIAYTAFLSFNAWFLLNVEKGDSYNSSAGRVTELNDGSNMLRFIGNLAIIYGLVDEKDPNLKWGYGNVTDKDNKYSKSYLVMPHNELLTSVAEYGYMLTIVFVLLSFSVSSPFFKFSNFDYFIPLFVYTLILWVRFMVIPSFEMVFIIFLFMLKDQDLKLEEQHAAE